MFDLKRLFLLNNHVFMCSCVHLDFYLRTKHFVFLVNLRDSPFNLIDLEEKVERFISQMHTALI